MRTVLIFIIAGFLFSGCAAVHQREIKEFHSFLQRGEVHRQEVIAKFKPAESLKLNEGLQADFYHTAVVVYRTSDGMLIYKHTFPEVEHWRKLANGWLWYGIARQTYEFAQNGDEAEKKTIKEVILPVLSSVMADAASIIELDTIKAARLGHFSDQLLRLQAQQQAEEALILQSEIMANSIQYSYQDNSMPIVNLTAPDRSSQMGTNFGAGLAAGMIIGMEKAELEKLIQEKYEFLKLYQAAKELYGKISQEKP